MAMLDRRPAWIAFSLVCLVAAGACGPFRVSDPPLPTATATLQSATVDLPRASYCWYMDGRGQCADSAAPDILLKSGYLKPIRTAGGFDARIKFKSASAPHLFRAELTMTPRGIDPVAVETPAALTLAVPAVTPGAAGVYVYTVTGTWQGSGEASFFLALELVPGSA